MDCIHASLRRTASLFQFHQQSKVIRNKDALRLLSKKIHDVPPNDNLFPNDDNR